MALSKCSALVINDKEENGLRLQLLLEKCNETLRDLFHNYFSKDSSILYQELTKHKPKLKILKQQGKLYQRQFILLFPTNKLTESQTFDITLVSLLLREFCNIKPPKTGWLKDPLQTDLSIGAYLVRIRIVRNELQHKSIMMNDADFIKFWNILSSSLLALNVNQSEITDIEQCALDQKTVTKLHQTELDLQTSLNTIQHLHNCLSSIWWNVSPNVQNYIGRGKDITRLHEQIINSDIHVTYGAVVTGLGGVGKTELVKNYCHTYGEACYNGNVIWFDADGAGTLESSFFKFAEFLELSVKDAYGNVSNIDSIVAKVYCFFANRKSLFIFDNVNNPTDINKFLPTSIPTNVHKPIVIITSQFTNWGKNITAQNLATFTKQTAELFISNNLSSGKIDHNDVESLALLTEYLPLALQQAVSYIQRNYISISKYIELFRSNSKALFSKKDDGMMYKHTVYTAWRMALDKLHDMKDTLELIHLMSFMNGKNINKDTLLKSKLSETELNDSLLVLASYSLITISQHDNEYVIIKIHSLLQIVIRETAPIVTQDKVLDLLQTQIDVSIADQFQFGDAWLDHILYLFQVATMNKQMMQRFFEFVIFIKQALLNKGKYNQCANFFTYILQEIEPFVSSGHIHFVIDIKSDIAKCLQYAGKYDEAKIKFIEIVAEEEKLNRPGRVIMKKYSLAICCLFQGSYSESLKILKEVKSLIIKLWGDTNNTNASLNGVDHGLGLCLLHTENYHEALKLFKEVEYFGKENYFNPVKMNEQYDIMKQEGMLPEVLTAKSCIATCLLQLGKSKKALKLFREIEEERTNGLGEFHPTTLQDKSNTAMCVAQYFDFNKGIEMLKAVEQKQCEILEEAYHPQVLHTQYNIGRSYQKRKRRDAALLVFIPLFHRQCQVLGKKHPKTLKTEQAMKKCRNENNWCCSRKRNVTE